MSEYDLDLAEDVEERPFNMEYFKRILGYTRPYRKTAVIASLLTLAGIIIGLVEPLLFRKAIDDGITTKDARTLIAVLATLLGFTSHTVEDVTSSNQNGYLPWSTGAF